MKKWENNIRKVIPYTPGEQPKEMNMIKLNTNENPYPPAPGVKKTWEQLRTDDLRAAVIEKDVVAVCRERFHEPFPDEKFVGSAVMHFDRSCDCLVTIGSGVLNDISKILSATAKIPYIVVATAPSMDGYASDSSSMELDGVKTSLYSKSPDVIIGDTDILKT